MAHPDPTGRRACLTRAAWWAWAARLGAMSPGLAMSAPAAPPASEPAVHPGRRLSWPRDLGSHPAARTEWWYLTGWLAEPGAPAHAPPAWGFQITFFRSRTDLAADSRSAFAPHQLIVLHAAVTDVAGQRLWHHQQVARAGLGVAEAAETDTAVHLRDAALLRQAGATAGRSVYEGRVRTPDFALQLQARSTQPWLLQGQAGYSRKGPGAAQASHYYSEPQLAVTASLQVAAGAAGASAAASSLQGRAWLDHEWSESVLDAQAVGWDWVGMNLDDGSALMAFRIRDRQGRAMWAGGGWRGPDGRQQDWSPHQVSWTPLAHWDSPRTRARYPTAWQLDVGGQRYTVRALVNDQEQDTRGSTGTAYWEGLSALHDAQGRRVGWGYLEMTGYAGKLSL
ncbi:MAG: hypothetical protein RI907_1771 [Pseudomonadota bacterium]|jgi:predicted secreted hydrolase